MERLGSFSTFIVLQDCISSLQIESDRESKNWGPGGKQTCSDSENSWDDKPVLAKTMWKTQINKDADPVKPINIIECISLPWPHAF